MNNRLYIGNRIIETPDELKELFGLEDMANPSSSLFNKMIDFVHDGILQEFLRENGETILAMKIGTIDLNASETTIMSDLIFIFTKNVVVVSSNPLDYISILDTKVELRENPLRFVAVFKVGILKKDNRQITMTISQEPARAKRMEDIWDYNNEFGLFNRLVFDKIKNMELNLNQLQQGKVVLFECDVEKNQNIYFKVGDAVVSKIAAKEVEQLAYQEAIKHNEIKNYLTIFPNGRHACELKERKELSVYEKCNTIDGCKEYLKLYPEGKYAKEINFRAWLFTSTCINSLVESSSFCGGKLRYEMVKTVIFLLIIVESGGYDALSNALSIIGDKARSMANYHGVDIEKEFKNLEQLLNGPASNDYKYQCLVSSSFYRALQQSIPENVHKAIDRNIAIVFPDIIP